MTSDEHRSQYRLPGELADKLREAADKNNRSMNAELVARLESTFGEDYWLRLIEEGCRRALAKGPA